MMFLQYFIWSAWYVTLGTYMLVELKASAINVGSTYATFSISAMLSPIFIGILADKVFNCKQLLVSLHLLGAVILYFLASTVDLGSFWWLVLAYTFLYTPTIALSNALTFSQLSEAGKQFPLIRVWGTVGWIVAGLGIGYLGLEHSKMIFFIAAAASFLMAVLALVLPKGKVAASRKKESWKTSMGIEALVLVKDRAYFIFLLISILMCIPLTFYYSFANPFLNDIGVQNSAAKMTLGQVSEAAFMLLIPLLFIRWGIKKMLIVALLCWIARYFLFAFGNADSGLWMLILGIALHGACYDFFFVTGQIYTESKASPAIKNAAQGLITFTTYGIGMFIGSYISGYLTEIFGKLSPPATGYNWSSVWMIPAYISIAVLLVLIVLFHEKSNTKKNEQKTSY